MRRQSLNTTRIIRPGTSHNNHQSQSATESKNTARPKHERTSPSIHHYHSKTHKHAHPATPGGPPPSTASQAATLPVPDVLLVTPLSKPPRIPPQQALNLTKHRPRSRIHETHTLITSTRIPEQGQKPPSHLTHPPIHPLSHCDITVTASPPQRALIVKVKFMSALQKNPLSQVQVPQRHRPRPITSGTHLDYSGNTSINSLPRRTTLSITQPNLR